MRTRIPQPPHDANADSFADVAEALSEYDLADLLSIVGGLQLVVENASRATRLEALAHCVASLQPHAGPQISPGKLRRICAHHSLNALAHYEDPAENQFAKEFTFYGGSYLVFSGIAQAGEFILANLCKALFLDPNDTLPRKYTSNGFQLVLSALTFTNAVAHKAAILRGTAPASDRYREIVVPDAERFRTLKNAVCLTTDEVGSLLKSAELPPSALDPLIAKAGDISLAQYDVVNGPLFWKPFVACNDKIILLIPGMVVSALGHALLLMAKEYGLEHDLALAYNRAVWQDVQRSLSFTGNSPLARRPREPLTIHPCSEGFFTLDYDKVLYCLLITDPLIHQFDSDPFGVWTTDTLETDIHARLGQVEKEVLSASPAPSDIFFVILFQGLGGGAAFGRDRSPANSPSVALSADALRTICLLEGGDRLALFNFARSRERLQKHVEITSTNILDEFSLYRHNEYSYYFSDRALPNVILIPPGDSLDLEMEIARRRDFHASTTPELAAVEVTTLHDTVSIPIYCPLSDLGKRARLLVEGYTVPIWVTAAGDSTDSAIRNKYALFVDVISYWIWQFTPALAPLLSSLETTRPITLAVTLPAKDRWRVQSHEVDNTRPIVEVSTDSAQNLMEVKVKEELIPLLDSADNRGERELMRHILAAFAPLIAEPCRKELTPAVVESALAEYAPVGMKKKLLVLDTSRTPEIDPRDLPAYRPLQKVWINEQLDQIGEYLEREKKLKSGEIPAERRTSVLNDVAAYCFKRMGRLMATLSPEGILQFVVSHAESVHREQAINRLTMPTRVQCFQSDADMIGKMVKEISEAANVGLASRLLIECVVAQPPRGLRPVSLDVYDELRAWAYHTLNYAMLSDAIHCGLVDHKLSLLPSTRLGIDGAAWQSMMSGHMRAFALDQIGADPEMFRSQWDPGVSPPQDADLYAELNSATEAEFGTPLSELLALMGVAIDIAQRSSPGTAMLSKKEFIEKAAKGMQQTEERVRTALDFLSLGPRPSFWTPPDGFVKQDLYPWRYNRPISYFRRPFLQSDRDGEAIVAWGPRHLRASQRFLIDQCTTGKLKAKTRRMRSAMNRRLDIRGKVFNKKVAAFFTDLGGLSVESQVKKAGLLRDLQNRLGDIDVLVGDGQRMRILVIECKDLSVARTPYEMAHEVTELFVGKEGKKSILEKHSARTVWVKSHLRDVLEFLKLDVKKHWKVSGLLVTDQPLVAPYIRHPSMRVLSFDELKRSWPKIGRA